MLAPGRLRSPAVLRRRPVPDTPWHRAASRVRWAAGEVVHRAWEEVQELGAIGPRTRRGRRFGAFGDGSVICFPPPALVNERYIRIGAGTVIGPQVSLSAGMVPGQVCVTDPVVRIGDRCLIGRGSGIVGHLSIEIGDDVWTGHHVYITDQNHGYEDLDAPDLGAVDARAPRAHRRRIVARLRHGRAARGHDRPPRRRSAPTASCAESIPDFSIAAGNPAKVIRDRHAERTPAEVPEPSA